MAPTPGFTPKTLPFLSSLKRHNDRRVVPGASRRLRPARARTDAGRDRPARQGLQDVCARAGRGAESPLFRIYRDTRFSADKSPLKTQVAAVFPHRALGRLEGAVLYLEVGPTRVLFAGGVHAPSGPELRRIRDHVARRFSQSSRACRTPRCTSWTAAIIRSRFQSGRDGRRTRCMQRCRMRS